MGEFDLRFAKILVLNLQLYLMHLKLMDKFSHVFVRHGGDVRV